MALPAVRFIAMAIALLGAVAAEGTIPVEQTGLASWYGTWHHGRRTANGERFNMLALTAAHRTLPLGTRIRVTNLENELSVDVRINDRGPYVGNRILDLSRAAAQRIGAVPSGVVRVRVEILDVPLEPSLASRTPANGRAASVAQHDRVDAPNVRRAAGRSQRAGDVRAPRLAARQPTDTDARGLSRRESSVRRPDGAVTSPTVRRAAGRLDRIAP